MIRQGFLVTSFTLAMVICSIGIYGIWREVGWRGLIGETNHYGVVEMVEGNLRMLHATRDGRPYESFSFDRRIPPLGQFSFGVGNNRAGWHYIGFTLPIWFVVITLLTHPTLAFFYGPVRRRNRRNRNECVRCGYSREGDTTGRCPECGLQWMCHDCGKDLLNRNATALLACSCEIADAP